jgi:hypothetical protein
VTARRCLGPPAPDRTVHRARQTPGLLVMTTPPTTPHLAHHGCVWAELGQRRAERLGDSCAGGLDRVTEGLQHRVDAGRALHLAWSITVPQKPGEA